MSLIWLAAALMVSLWGLLLPTFEAKTTVLSQGPAGQDLLMPLAAAYYIPTPMFYRACLAVLHWHLCLQAAAVSGPDVPFCSVPRRG